MSAVDRLPIATPRDVRRAIGRELAPEKRAIAAVAGLFVAAAAAGAALPVLLGRVVDGIDIGWTAARVHLVCAALLGCVMVQLLVSRLGRRLAHRLGDRSAARIRERLLEHVLRLPMRVVEQGGAGDVSTRTTGDVDAVAGLLRSTGPEVAAAVIEALVVVIAAFVVAPVLALLLVVVAPPLLMAARAYVRRARPAFLAERAARSDLVEALAASVVGARTIAAHGLQDQRAGIGHGLAGQQWGRQRRIIGLQSWFLPTLDLAYTLPVAAILCLGGVLALDGHGTAGAVVASAMLAYRLSGPLDRIMFSLTEFQEALAAFARIEGVSLLEPERRTARANGREVQLRQVRFGYGDGPDVLGGLDLPVRAGEHLAIVGRSGAGKSTVALLIAGIERPQGGVASIGGAPSADIVWDELRRAVVLIAQEHHVFTGSLRDNLTLARDADDATLRAVLRRVGAVWAEELPAGLGTVVGDRQLSLGQAQQLALARVALADPDIVILDEATVGLDAGIAATGLAGRTLITITHQLPVAAAADRIAVIDRGRVVELGPHAELVAADGIYARLWAAWTSGRERAIGHG